MEKNKGERETKRAVKKIIGSVLNSEQKKLYNREADFFLRFLAVFPVADTTLQVCEGLWSFLQWLKKNGYSIVHTDDLLTAQLSKLVNTKDLK